MARTVNEETLFLRPDHRTAKRLLAAADSAPDADPNEIELADLDALIAEARKACHKGQKVRGRRNPAFANLVSLMKARDLLLKATARRPKRSKAESEVAAQMDELLGGKTNVH